MRRSSAFRLSLTSLVGGLFLLFACSSGPTTGILPTYDDSPIDQIYLLPIYTSNSMGLGGDARRQLHQRYESQLLNHLDQASIALAPSDDIDDVLGNEAEYKVADLNLRHSLFHHFQPRPNRSRAPLESRIIQGWANHPPLSNATYLAVEIAYHSVGRCLRDPTATHPYARLFRADNLSVDPPHCVTAHLRAALIDGRQGVPIWRHHGFAEIHADRIDDGDVDRAISRAIELLFDDDSDFRTLLIPA